MARIFNIGDIHLALGYPNKVDRWFPIHKQYFDEFLIPFLEENVRAGDIIIQMGDLFDNRNVIPINIMNYAMDQVERLASIAPTHIIIGNHDCWSISSDKLNAIRPFKYIPNVSIYDETTVVEYNGLNLLLMPYIHSKKEQIRLIQENSNCSYLFCHSDLNGCKMHLTSVAHRNTDKIDIEEFESFKRVLSGHIHLVQDNKNFTFVGSIFQMDRNDYNDQKGIFVLDTDTNDLEFYPNNISPVFKKVVVSTEDDIEKLNELKGSKDYIDVYISNKLLMTNRKLRRQLEIVLEDSGFEKVEYIDDIEVDESEAIEILDEERIHKLINDTETDLDYGEYIREYIKKSEYGSDNLKRGILNEYNEILTIYIDSMKTN